MCWFPATGVPCHATYGSTLRRVVMSPGFSCFAADTALAGILDDPLLIWEATHAEEYWDRIEYLPL